MGLTFMGESFFPNIQSFRKLLIQYQRSSGTAFSIHNGKKLKNRRLVPDNDAPSSCQYAWVKFECVHNKKKRGGYNQPKRQFDHLGCPAAINLTYDSKRDGLRVSSANFTHNHTLSPEFSEQYASNRKLSEQQKWEVLALFPDFKVDDVKCYMYDTYGIKLTSQDVRNLCTAMRKIEHPVKDHVPAPIFQLPNVFEMPSPNIGAVINEASQSNSCDGVIEAGRSVNAIEEPVLIKKENLTSTIHPTISENTIETCEHSIEATYSSRVAKIAESRELVERIYELLIQLDADRYTNVMSSLHSVLDDMKSSEPETDVQHHKTQDTSELGLSNVYVPSVLSTSTGSSAKPPCERVREKAVKFRKPATSSQRKFTPPGPMQSDEKCIRSECTPSLRMPSNVNSVRLTFRAMGSRTPVPDVLTATSDAYTSLNCKSKQGNAEVCPLCFRNDLTDWAQCYHCHNRLHRQCVQVIQGVFTCPVCFNRCEMY